MHVKPIRPYRCHYHPNDRFGSPVVADSGVLPFVTIKAASAEDAHRKAQTKTGCAIANVERLEGGVQ